MLFTGDGDKMVVYFLCGEYSKSEEAIIKWIDSLQAAYGRSPVCAMATTTAEISTSSLCLLPHVVV